MVERDDVEHMQEIRNIRRRASLAVTPQALGWDGNSLWLSSRDLGTLYKVDPEQWKIVENSIPRDCLGRRVHERRLAFYPGEGTE